MKNTLSLYQNKKAGVMPRGGYVLSWRPTTEVRFALLRAGFFLVVLLCLLLFRAELFVFKAKFFDLIYK